MQRLFGNPSVGEEQIRFDISQKDEHRNPFRYARIGQSQMRYISALLAKQQEVQIDDARAEPYRWVQRLPDAA